MIYLIDSSSYHYFRYCWLANLADNRGDIVVPLLPSFDARVIQYDFDILNSPDSIETLLNEGAFEYAGHTWNDVLNCKCTGTLISANYNDNAILRNLRTPIRFIRWGSEYDYHYQFDLDRHGKGERLITYLCEFLLYSHLVDCYYTGFFQYYVLYDSDGQTYLSDAYGSNKGHDGYIRLWNFEVYHLTNKDYANPLRYYKDYVRAANWSMASTQLYIQSSDSHQRIMQRIREITMVDATQRQDHKMTYTVVSSAWTLLGGKPPQPRCPNYDTLFPEKDRNPNWKEIAGNAYQSLGMADINGVANISELLEMGSTVASFAKTLQDLPSTKVKGAASAWLAVHFGFKLTILDAVELNEVMEKYVNKRSNLSKIQAAATHISNGIAYNCRYQVFYDEFANVRSILERLLTIADAYPTLENSWDMVPWSFVIDWFLNLGDILQSLDVYANLRQKHDVICCGRSIKARSQIPHTCLGIPDGHGVCYATYYRRAYQKNLILPSLVPSVTINPFNHLIEAAALYISTR